MLKLTDQNSISWPVRILWIFTGLFSLGQLQRIEISPQIAFYLHDLFVAIWLFFVLLFKPNFYYKIVKTFINVFRKSFWMKIVFAFFILSLLTTAAYCFINATFVPILYLSRLIWYAVFALSINLLLNVSEINSNYLRFQYLTAGGLIAALGLLQFILLPDVRFLYLYGWDDHFFRLVGTLFDPAFTGLVLLIAFLYSLKINKSGLIITFFRLMLVIAMILTFSRSTYLSALIALIYLKISKSKFDRKFILKIFLIAVLIVSGSIMLQIYRGGEGTALFRTSTISARLENSTEYFRLIDKVSIFSGKGWFTSPGSESNFPDHSKVPDNLLIMLAYTLGFPGLLVVITAGYKTIFKQIKHNSIFFSVLIAVFIHAQFNNAVFQPFVWLYLWWGAAVFYKIRIKA